MRRIFFLLLFAQLAHCFAEVPRWIKNPEKEYPVSDFVKAVGEGKSLKGAKDDAISGISMYFDVSTEIATVLSKSASEIVSGDKSMFAGEQSYSQVANVTSSSDFFCVSFTDSYYDEKRDTYSVLAYIKKSDAAKIYNSRISFLLSSVKTYRNCATGAADRFTASRYLGKACSLSKLAQSYIKNETTLVPADIDRYGPVLEGLAALPAEFADAKRGLSFKVAAVQYSEEARPLYESLSQILEGRGYVYALGGAMYSVVVDVSLLEDVQKSACFVRPSVKIIVMNSEGESLYSYSKTYKKVGSSNMDNAKRRALVQIQKDVEENFLAD